MILFLFTIMLMNLNKENEVHKPRITRLGAVVSLLDNCRFNFGLHQLKTYHWRIHKYWRGLSIYIKVLGKVLLNEYMVPFEFASVLLLVAMIGTVLLSKKKKQRNNMNNILNEIGIENYIFLSTILFCIGVFGV
jgi:NADH-quinone oxidoreductase subunit J